MENGKRVFPGISKSGLVISVSSVRGRSSIQWERWSRVKIMNLERKFEE